jgi:fumarate reductase flavoprotein subunit
MRTIKTDILILGAGGAGLFAALHARKADPKVSITLAVKGVLGQTGSTRLSEGGYNVAVGADDSVERHFMDTMEVGKWLPDQDLAWAMVKVGIERFHELEDVYGCVFDRNPDGTMHQKQFAGHSFNRTVHRGDLTGVEINNRLCAAVLAAGIDRLEQHRAVELVKNKAGDALAGVLMTDMTSGEFVFVQAQATLLATGGGPSMYKYFSPSADKTCDGMAMALRAGLTLRDMEMVQFHPNGLLDRADTHLTPMLLEEALRNAGAYLVNGQGERFMAQYDAKGELATRDIVSRAMYAEMRASRATPNGGIFLSVAHFGDEMLRKNFSYMIGCCAQFGCDLLSGRVEVVPTAHFMMGGIVIKPDCATELNGLFVAGEDAGGVHGANRLSGNGLEDCTVFGGVFGDSAPRWVRAQGAFHEPGPEALAASVAASQAPLAKPRRDLGAIREALYHVMWDEVGIARDAAGLNHAAGALDEIEARLNAAGVDAKSWHDWLDLRNLALVSQAIRAAALSREDSRGAHFRSDFPTMREVERSRYTCVNLNRGKMDITTNPVAFSRVKPGETLLRT